jgi:hypothetical protein
MTFTKKPHCYYCEAPGYCYGAVVFGRPLDECKLCDAYVCTACQDERDGSEGFCSDEHEQAYFDTKVDVWQN